MHRRSIGYNRNDGDIPRAQSTSISLFKFTLNKAFDRLRLKNVTHLFIQHKYHYNIYTRTTKSWSDTDTQIRPGDFLSP